MGQAWRAADCLASDIEGAGVAFKLCSRHTSCLYTIQDDIHTIKASQQILARVKATWRGMSRTLDVAMRSGSCTSCGLMSFMSSSAASVQPPISRTVSSGQALRFVTQGCRITLDSVIRSRGFCRQMPPVRISAVQCLLQQ